MGMFDYIKCEYPLPDGYTGPLHNNWQTKDLDCTMDTYTITAGGRLVAQPRHWEKVSEEPEPSEEDRKNNFRVYAEWFRRTHKRVSDPPKDLEYHGDIEFYSSNVCCSGPFGYATDDDSPFDSREYKARFTNGQLEWIRGGQEQDEIDRFKDSPHLTRDEWHKLNDEEYKKRAASQEV